MGERGVAGGVATAARHEGTRRRGWDIWGGGDDAGGVAWGGGYKCGGGKRGEYELHGVRGGDKRCKRRQEGV